VGSSEKESGIIGAGESFNIKGFIIV
jgi:hypothetical protein